MRKLICCLILFCSCGKYTNMNRHNIDIDKIFKDWNVATSNSILFGITSTNNEQQKALFENRLKALKSYLEINDFEMLNTNSIRYEFLKESMKDWKDKFYIIEANKSGEQVSIVSYILLPNENSTSKILKYENKKGAWTKIEEYTANFSFEFEKKKYSTAFGKGENHNDVIVTFIENGHIISSDYFLFSTMKSLELQ